MVFYKEKAKVPNSFSHYMDDSKCIIESYIYSFCFSYSLALLAGYLKICKSNANHAILGIQNTSNFMVFIVIIFILIVTLSSIIRLSILVLYKIICIQILVAVYEKTLYQPYSTHIQRNTAEIVSICTTESGQPQSIIDTLLKLSTSLFTATLVLVLY